MSWTNAITQLIESGNPISRSYKLYARNGYQRTKGIDYEVIDVQADGWGISIEDGNPVIGNARFKMPYDKRFLSQTDINNPLGLFSEGKFKLTIDTPTGSESEYIFRGTLRTSQQADYSLLVEAADCLAKMDKALAGLSMIADISGPWTDVALAHDVSNIWDAVGTFYTYEINPIPLYDWAVDPATLVNRSWVPGIFEIERLDGADWVPVLPSEFIVDTVLGLVRFGNDQFGESLRLKSVSVYIEGTLEVVDVIEEILTISDECPTLGCGFPDSMLRIACTGTLTFVVDITAPYDVTGAGTDFQGELRVGDRVALDADPDNYGVISFIDPVLQEMKIRYIYPGTPGASGTFFKSTLRESGISLTNINWDQCSGTAAALYRELQTNYADSKGYKIWYDPMIDKIVGDQVRILDASDPVEAANIIDVGPLLVPPTIQEVTEDFATAVAVSGVVGRAKNLCSMPGVVATALALALPPEAPEGNIWWEGPSWDAAWYNAFISYALGFKKKMWNGPWYFGTPGISALIDGDIDTAYAVHHVYNHPSNSPSGWADATNTYYDFVKIDLLAVYEIDQIDLIRMNCHSSKTGNKMYVNIYVSVDDVNYILFSPEAYEMPMGPDEKKSIVVEGVSARYIKLTVRPTYVVYYGTELTIGFRELVIYGSMKVCEIACIQDQIAHGERQNGTGTVTFTAGSNLIDGAATDFGGVGEPQVGDYIAPSTDEFHWGIIEEIIAATGVGCVRLRYEWGGVGVVTGNLLFSDGTAPFAEGNGGHFVGGYPNADNFIRDYYPDLMAKISPFGMSTMIDDSDLVLTDMQAKDRAYLMLNDVIRIYRMVSSEHGFDCRPRLFDTLRIIDDHRTGPPEEILILLQKISLSDRGASYAGTDYAAGVLS